jgi:SepF-like predicted cell division protein (DUF552 family)
MNILQKIGIVRSSTKGAKIFESLLPETSFLNVQYSTPKDYIEKYWKAYKALGETNNSLNGAMFELITSTLLVREKLLPMYLQAEVSFVPGIFFDLILYSKEIGPICLSMKTSLRERYHQADLEAIALKYVHRKSKYYLLSLDKKEVMNVKSGIKSGKIIGIDDVCYCLSDEINGLIEKLKQIQYSVAGTVEVVSSNRIVTEKDLVEYK